MPRDADSDGRTQEADQAQIENTRRLFCGEVIAGNDAALQDKFYVFEDGRVFERIAVDGDDVGEISAFNCSGFHADQIGCVDGGGLDGVDRLHAPLDHFAELFGVVAVRIDAGVAAESDFGSCFESFTKVFALQAANFLFFFDGVGEHARFFAHLENVVVVVDVEDKIRAVLFGEGDAFVVDEAGVLDGIDAGTDRVLDGLCTVGVCGDFAAEFVGLFGDGSHFFEGVLRRAGLIAFAENAAGSADFDDVGAVFDDFANFGASGPRAVGDAFCHMVILRGQKIVVTMAAGDSERRARDEHARTRNFASVDSVANCDVGVASCAHIADGGEAGQEREASVLGTGYGAARNRDAEACVAAMGRVTGDVSVDVNQAGKAGGLREIDGAGGERRACGGDGGDRAVGVEGDELIFEQAARANVNELTAADGTTGSGLRDGNN